MLHWCLESKPQSYLLTNFLRTWKKVFLSRHQSLWRLASVIRYAVVSTPVTQGTLPPFIPYPGSHTLLIWACVPASILCLGHLSGAPSEGLPGFWFPTHSQGLLRSPWLMYGDQPCLTPTLSPEPQELRLGPEPPDTACPGGELCQCQETQSQMSVALQRKHKLLLLNSFLKKIFLQSRLRTDNLVQDDTF